MKSKSSKAVYDIVFVGGVFTDDVFRKYVASSRGVIQNAADVFQKNIIMALRPHCSVVIINLPFIGSYPSLSSYRYIPASDDVLLDCPVSGQGFFNHRFLRLFSRFYSSFVGLQRASVDDQVVVVYSAHLPFLAAAWLFKLLKPRATICLVIPDLPEHMGLAGAVFELFKSVTYPLSHFFIRRFDKVIGLTKYVKDYLGLDDKAYLVLEGIASEAAPGLDELKQQDNNGRIRIFYSGTLARRYGIGRLLSAFKMLNREDVELVICGEGDALSEVKDLASKDRRVVYLGQLPRAEAVAWQTRADILVNPRVTESVGDFTYFSFPSKIMEYLSSGTPVVMYKLAGVPDEYDDYYFRPVDNSVGALASCLESVCSMPVTERRRFGAAAKGFVSEYKTPIAQGVRLYRHVFADSRSHSSAGDDLA